MPRKFIPIQKPFDKRMEFVKALYEADIPDSWYCFDKLDCSESLFRQRNEEMTFDKYFEQAKKGNHIVFSIGQEEINPKTLEEITTISLTMCFVYFPESPRTDNFFWYFCPNEEKQYNLINDIFKKIYNKEMEFKAP